MAGDLLTNGWIPPPPPCLLGLRAVRKSHRLFSKFFDGVSFALQNKKTALAKISRQKTVHFVQKQQLDVKCSGSTVENGRQRKTVYVHIFRSKILAVILIFTTNFSTDCSQKKMHCARLQADKKEFVSKCQRFQYFLILFTRIHFFYYEKS
jgi:hypothetical protein